MQSQLIWTCPVCRLRARIPSTAERIHCACGFVQLGVSAGLGDVVAAVLHAMGLTQQRYMQAKMAMGLKKKCGCAKRKAALNELGKKIGIG